MSSGKQQLSRLKSLLCHSKRRGRRGCRYNPEVKQLVRELFEQGLSISELCRETNISNRSLRKWLAPKLDPKDNRFFHQLLVSNDKAYEIVLPNGARIHGLSFDEVFKVVTHAAA